MTDNSRRQFADFSTANVGKPIDVRIDDKSVTKPIIREPIWGGSFQIDVSRREDSQDLAERLTSGKATLEVAPAPH